MTQSYELRPNLDCEKQKQKRKRTQGFKKKLMQIRAGFWENLQPSKVHDSNQTVQARLKRKRLLRLDRGYGSVDPMKTRAICAQSRWAGRPKRGNRVSVSRNEVQLTICSPRSSNTITAWGR